MDVGWNGNRCLTKWWQMSNWTRTEVKWNSKERQTKVGRTDVDGRLTNDRQSNEQMSSCNVALQIYNNGGWQCNGRHAISGSFTTHDGCHVANYDVATRDKCRTINCDIVIHNEHCVLTRNKCHATNHKTTEYLFIFTWRCTQLQEFSRWRPLHGRILFFLNLSKIRHSPICSRYS